MIKEVRISSADITPGNQSEIRDMIYSKVVRYERGQHLTKSMNGKDIEKRA